MNSLFCRFASAIGFLTVLPVGPQRKEGLRGSVAFFPVVGLMLGILFLLQCRLLGPFLNPSLNALGIVLAGVVLTRGLHLDGFADSADGLLSHQSPQRMLDIMRDSRIGTMGALAIFFDLMMRWQLLAHCPVSVLPQALILPPVLGRMAMGVGMIVFAYARSGGLASEFLPVTGRGNLPVLLSMGAVVAGLLALWQGLFLWSLALLTCLVFLKIVAKRLGGYTGDILGATNEVVEIACLTGVVLAR